MLEIGSSLHEARVRGGLELAQVDADTHIRTRYLKALEDERFDLVPGPAYVRGFLRTYADYLGLDADLLVAEYNARFAPPEEPPPQLTPLRRLEPRTLRFRGTVAAVLAVAVGGFAVLLWRLDTGGEPTERAPAAGPAMGKAGPTPTSRPAPLRPKRQARQATLVLTAARGPCWLLVHVGSPEGRYLHEGTLEQGESLRFAGRVLWIRLGAPRNLDATVNGDPASLPNDTANVVVTRTGIRVVEGG